MKFDPFEVSVPHIAYTLLGGFVVIFGMFSLWLKARLYISEAVWATVFGIIVGPYCAGIFDPRAWAGDVDTAQGVETTNVVTLEVMRVVLAIGVFAIGVELPKAYLWRHVRSVLLILFPVMGYGWVVCAGLIYGLVPGLNFLSSLIVAACLTPTDPILASAVVGGKWADKHVPAHLRHLLAAESGVNDGLAFPFLYIALYLFLENGNAGTAVGEWVYWTILYEVTLGCVLGTILGVGFRHLMQFCERKDLIDRTSYLAQYVSLALLAIGVTTLLGTDDLLCAFFAGTGFGWNGFFQKQTEDSMFSNAMDLLFNVAAFVYIGAWLPFSSYADARLTLSVWRLVVLGILVILVRRIPVCLAVYTWIPDIKTFREALFTGHFGPMGVGAIFISTLAATQLPSKGALGEAPYSQEQLLSGSLQPIVSFIVLASVLSHGLSVPAFSLSKRVHSLGIGVHTRSWSRQASRDLGQPEWATQARRVHRPEDIVINRDIPDLEKGLRLGEDVEDGRVLRGQGDEGEEMGAMDRENEKPRIGGAHVEGGTEEVGVESELEGSPAGTSGTRFEEEEEMDGELQGRGRRMRGQDGEGTDLGVDVDLGVGVESRGTVEDVEEGEPKVSTWRQGNYVVVERDPGHGGDVQVEVVRRSIVPGINTQQTFTGRTLEEARALGREYVEKLEKKAKEIRAELLRDGKITTHQDRAKEVWGERTLRRLSGLSVESVSDEGHLGPAGGSAATGVREKVREALAGPSAAQSARADAPEDAWRHHIGEADPDVVPGLPAGEPLDEQAVDDSDLPDDGDADGTIEDGTEEIEEIEEETEPTTTDPSPSSLKPLSPVPEPGTIQHSRSLKFRETRPPLSPDSPVREMHYPHHHSKFIRNAKRAIVHAAHGHGGHPSGGRRASIRRSLLSASGRSRNKSASPPAPGEEGEGRHSLAPITIHAQHQRSQSNSGDAPSSSRSDPPRPILTTATSVSSLRDSPAPSTHSSSNISPNAVPASVGRLRSPSPTRGSRAASPARSVRFSDPTPGLPVPGSAPPFVTTFAASDSGPGTANDSSEPPSASSRTSGTTASAPVGSTNSRVRFDASVTR